MPRRTARPKPTREIELPATTRTCPACGGVLWAAYESRRTVAPLDGLVRLAIQVRRRRGADCPRRGAPLRSEREGGLAPPQHEFGLDVIALIGAPRHVGHRSVPEIHDGPTRRGVAICARGAAALLDRYDELLALAPTDAARIRRLTAAAGRAIPAIDGPQPDVGHEVPWALRDALGGEVLLARGPLSSCRGDLAGLVGEARDALRGGPGEPGVTIAGVISGGQHAARDAVAAARPGVPHQLCPLHYLREAARPICEADRHAEARLKKGVRGIRPIERQVEARADPEAGAVRGYCAAVRSALADDGRPPLGASGLRLRGRLAKVAEGLDRAGVEGGSRGS